MENQELNARVMTLSSKVALVESALDDARNQAIKFEYEIKYLKEKELAFNKKLTAKDVEYNEMKSRLEF